MTDVRPESRTEDHEISSQKMKCRRSLTFNLIDSFPYFSTVNQSDLVLGNFPYGEDDHARRASGTLECFENTRNSSRLFGVVITEMFVLSHARVVTVAYLSWRGDTGHVSKLVVVGI